MYKPPRKEPGWTHSSDTPDPYDRHTFDMRVVPAEHRQPDMDRPPVAPLSTTGAAAT